MKIKLLFYIIVFTSTNCLAQTIDLPSKISDLKKGIIVKHSKKKVYAELNKDYPTRGGKYKFKYSTSVKTKLKGLKIIQFGAFSLINNEWIERNVIPFNNTEFSEWYNCPNGLIHKGITYKDPSNWSSCDDLSKSESKILWYYIGINSNNEKFVGYDLLKIVKKIKQ